MSSEFNWFNSNSSNNRIDRMWSCFWSKNTTENIYWIWSSCGGLDSHHLTINHQVITNVYIKSSNSLNWNLVCWCICDWRRYCCSNSSISWNHSTIKIFIFYSNITIIWCKSFWECENSSSCGWCNCAYAKICFEWCKWIDFSNNKWSIILSLSCSSNSYFPINIKSMLINCSDSSYSGSSISESININTLTSQIYIGIWS